MIPLAVVITEGVPVKDTAEFFAALQGLLDAVDRPIAPA